MERLEALRGNSHFGLANISFRKQNLPLQIGEANHIVIHQCQMANPSGCQIKRGRTP
jgi:hypothetical protein